MIYKEEELRNYVYTEKEMEFTQESWWLALVLGGASLLLWLIWSWNDIRFLAPLKGSKLPQGSMGLPFIGELIPFLWYFKVVRRPDDFILSKRKRYGDGVGIYKTCLFGSPSIIGCSPAFNKFVLQSDQLFPTRWPSPELLGLSSLGVLNGKPHTRLRSYVTNAVNKPDALRKLAQMVQPLIVSGLRSWADKGRVNGLHEIKKVNFENIGRIFVSLEPGPLLETIERSFEGMVEGLRATPLNFPGTTFHRALQCRKKLTTIFRKELEKRKENRSGANDRNDLMEGLMRMKDEEGKQLNDEEVLDNIVSLVLGGYESTSHASMWALYFLAKSPDVLQRLRSENIALSKQKKGDFVTTDDVAQLKYTNKVVEETVRMANISPFMFREVKEDVIYKGYTIPKGWRMMVWIRHLHTDPNNFEDPMKFNPERWNEPAKSGTFQAFGGGSRICAANMFARLQLAIFFHHLVVGYKWELINPDAKIMYLPHPKPEDGVEIAISAI